MTQVFDVERVLAQLTLEEKASLTSGSDFWHTQGVERAGVPAVMVTDGPHGLRKQPEEADHLGLGNSVPATCFPTAAALGSSWDVELVTRVGEALGRETRANDVAVLLGPGVNIKRTPLCGRNFEYVSEDPVVAGELGTAIVRGIQSQGVGTSLKHFAANNQESDRMRVSAEVDERTLREIYLPAFERVVTNAQPWTVMCAYNKVNGTYASENHWLLTELLRDEWAFEGLVVSDWGAVHDRVPALAAGLDLQMPAAGPRPDEEVVAAVRDGSLDEAVLDVAARRVLGLIARSLPGLESDDSFDVDAHHELAREAAAAGSVLLKNDGGLLPLASTEGVAVIGEFARTPRYQGAGSSQVNPTRLDAPLDALRAAGGEFPFAPGFTIAGGPSGDDAALLAEAVGGARRGDRRRVPRPARSRRVRGLRPPAARAARQPGGPAPGGRRGQPAGRRRARQRLGGERDRLARPRPGDPGDLARRPGRRVGRRGPAARRPHPVRPAHRDDPAPHRGHPRVRELPRRGRRRPLRRGRAGGLPLVRHPRDGRRVPVRSRPVVHDVRATPTWRRPPTAPTSP